MFHQSISKPVGRCVADEAAVRRVHDNGHAPWLARVTGFLVPQAPDLGSLSADSGQSLKLNQS